MGITAMHPGVRVFIFASCTILILLVVSLSGQVILWSGKQATTGTAGSGSVPNPTTDQESSFTLTVVPVEARARPGDPVDCAVTITPLGEFHDPVSLQLDVNAEPVFKGSYNAGVMEPPFPKTYEYRVVVPPQAPAPLTVRGTLTAEGGGHREVVELELLIIQ